MNPEILNVMNSLKREALSDLALPFCILCYIKADLILIDRVGVQ